ncbi:MAG: hypothetical protein ACMZI0_05275 [Symbiopectobacterium sp.]
MDNEWPQLKQRFIAWLAQENFDAEGKQIQTLADFRLSQPKG